MEKTLNIALLFFVPLFMIGLINRTKAIMAGRKGMPILQPWYDIIKLLKKGEVITSAGTIIFKVAPSVALAATLLATLCIPMINNQSILSFNGDFIVFAYLLGIAKFFQILGAMDTGSSFEGMGASREAVFSTFAEPALFLLLGTMCLLVGKTSFEDIFWLNRQGESWEWLLMLVSVMLFLIMLLLETCRIPVDDPNTHLELTMIHEVMILDNSGPDLAYIHLTAALKMFIFSALIASAILPPALPFAEASLFFIAILAACAITVGLIESIIARFRMSHLPQFLFLMLSLAFAALAIVILFDAGGLS